VCEVERYFHRKSKIIAHASSSAIDLHDCTTVLRTKEDFWNQTQNLQAIAKKVNGAGAYVTVLVLQSILAAALGVLLNVPDYSALLFGSIVLILQICIVAVAWITSVLQVSRLAKEIGAREG
jgi:flavorubredoxin